MGILERRRDATRWIYVVGAAVALIVLVMAAEGGPSAMWPFVVLFTFCVIQTVYPTMVVWMLILIVFAVLTVLIATGMPRDPLDEYLSFLGAVAVPTILVVLFGRSEK